MSTLSPVRRHPHRNNLYYEKKGSKFELCPIFFTETEANMASFFWKRSFQAHVSKL